MTPKFTFASGARRMAGKGVLHAVLVSGTQTDVVREGDIRTLNLGIGKRPECGRREIIAAARRIVSVAKQYRAKKIAISFDDFLFPKLKNTPHEDIAARIAENIVMANFEFVTFKTKPKTGWNFITDVIVSGARGEKTKRGFREGALIGEEVNKCRALANTPGGDMTPKGLARAARDAVKGVQNVSVRVLGRAEMRKKKMGAVLGVAQGSNEEPQFIILEYRGTDAEFTPPARAGQARNRRGKNNTGKNGRERPIVLVGKGVTFDTGGLNLKPSNAILEMHMDMSGGAAVIHTIALAARLGVQKNIIGLVPAVENMPSGSSYRPGDVLRSMSGKTIEVQNTDAEGRVIMADALHYAKQYKPELVIDAATLTGGAIVALGQRMSGLFTSDEKLERTFRALGDESGEYVWPLPCSKENEDDTRGVFGDVANVPPGGSQASGSATSGAAFLAHFIKDKSEKPAYPWVHIDISPRMTSIPTDYLAKGAAGAPIRLLIRFLQRG